MKQDLIELSSSYPNIYSFSSVRGILDTNILIRTIHPEIPSDLSLKKMVSLYLSSNMQKGQQKSNWAYRPLKDVQIKYAACDALVLLRLYDTKTCEAEEKNSINIKELLQNYNRHSNNDMNNNKKTKKKRKKNKSNSNDNDNNNNNDNTPIYNKEIPCSNVESTGTHIRIGKNDDILSLIHPNKKHRQHQQKVWKPLHVYGRKVIVVGMNNKNRNKILI